jgi:hypothetical protein
LLSTPTDLLLVLPDFCHYGFQTSKQNCWNSDFHFFKLPHLSMSGLPDFSWHNIHTKVGKMYQIITMGHKIYQVAVKLTKRHEIPIPTSSIVRPFKIYPNWGISFEYIPSGNPDLSMYYNFFKRHYSPRIHNSHSYCVKIESIAMNWFLTHCTLVGIRTHYLLLRMRRHWPLHHAARAPFYNGYITHSWSILEMPPS